MNFHRLLLAALLLVFSCNLGSAQDWAQFRGPNGSGHAQATDIPAQWSQDENVRWTIDVPGRGWSSPVVAGDELWMTTAIEIKAEGEEAEKLLETARIPGLVPYTSVELAAICVDRETGNIKHQVVLFRLNEPPLINSLNSFASPTPVVDGKRVFVNFGTHGTACLDRSTAEVVWKNQTNQLTHETGAGSSPIVVDDLLILHCDGIDHQYVVAMNKSTGENVWKTKRTGDLNPNDSLKKAFTTPALAQLDDQKVLISPGADWVYVYDVETGKELSRTAYGESTGFSNAPVPLIDGEVAYICTGFMKSTLIALNFHAAAKDSEEAIQWRFKGQVPTMSSPILVDGNLYMVSDRSGILTCVSAETGKEIWRHRLAGGFSSAPIYVDGKLILSNQAGKSFVVRPGDQFELLSENQLDSDIMSTPAAVDNQLYIRTRNKLYRIQKSQ